MSFDWKSLTAEELELQFNPRAVPANHGDFDRIFAELSATARASLKHEMGVRYGTADQMLMDIFPADDPSAPTMIFIHGGYWRARTKDEFGFVAGAFTPRGVTTINLDYDLCPKVTLDDIVAEIIEGVDWIARNCAAKGGNPDRLYIAGHSAGAHLAAMVLATDWAARGLPKDLIKGATLMSGIYDPEPARHISVYNDLHLTEEMAARCNALVATPTTDCPILTTVGGVEPEGWIDQSRQYQEKFGGDLIISPNDGHLGLLQTHCDGKSDLFKAQLSQMGIS